MNIRSIGIVGYGDFGAFLLKLIRKRFPEVVVKVSSSRNPPDGKDFYSFEEVCKTDLLIPCVPISAFDTMIDRLLPHLGERTVVCDVTTVKKHSVEVLKRKRVPHYIATHPMFGPYSYEKHGNSLMDLRIAVCDSSLLPEDTARAISFLRGLELTVLELSADEHDRLIAETLFLTHFIGQAIKRGKFERTSIDTVSFGFLMDAAESVAHDDALFRDIFMYNPYCKEVVERYKRAEAEVLSELIS